MTYDQLRVLDAIITGGSFRAASELLHRSQPSVSVAIKKLEEEFDILLFSRDQYRPVLTPEGKAFHKKARTVLAHTETLEVLGNQLSMGSEAEILISADAILPVSFILGILQKYEKEHPLTELELSVDYLGASLERVENGEVNLGMVPLLTDCPLLESHPLIIVPMIPVAAPHFLPAQENREKSDEEMKQFIQVIVKGRKPGVFGVNHGVLEGGRQWGVHDFYTKREILLGGLGWGRLPEYLIRDDLNAGRLVPLDVQGVKTSYVEISVIRRKDRPVGPVASMLWDEFIELSKLAYDPSKYQ